MIQYEIVIPAYNESKNLPTLVERTVSAAKAAGFSPDQFQCLLINNGSQDNSAEVINELKKSPLGDWFRPITVKVNKGYGYGLWAGLKETKAPTIGWSHADLQCDPHDIMKALKIMNDNKGTHTLVKGVRRGRNWKDIMVTRFFEFLAWVILGNRFHEINAQPKVFPRGLIDSFKNPPRGFPFDLYGLYWAKKNGYQFKTVQVDFPSRIHGMSNWAGTFFSRYKTIGGMILFMLSLARKEGRL